MRLSLDLLRPDEVVWMPWDNVQQRHYRTSTYRGTLKCMKFSEPYMPDRVTRQFDKVQPIPIDPIRPKSRTRKLTLKSYEAVFFPTDDHWDEFPNYQSPILMLPNCTTSTQTVDGYVSWLQHLSHSYMYADSKSVMENERPMPAYIESVIKINHIQGIVNKTLRQLDTMPDLNIAKAALQRIHALVNVQPVEAPVVEAAEPKGYVPVR